MPVASCPLPVPAPKTQPLGLIQQIRCLLRDDSLTAADLISGIDALLTEAEKPPTVGGLLVISRHDGEFLKIGENVLVGFGGMKGSEGRILIRAPRNVHVVRMELVE